MRFQPLGQQRLDYLVHCIPHFAQTAIVFHIVAGGKENVEIGLKCKFAELLFPIFTQLIARVR